MFLDDELESICQDETICKEKSFMLFQACLKRIPKPDQVRPQDFLNEIRKIEGGWKLFCKRHPQYRPEGFRDLMMKRCGDILSKPVLGEFKTTTDIRDLTKVGALAAALIDRLQGEVAVEIEEKPRIISSFIEKHPTNGIISITINTSEKWVTYQINKVATRGFVNITMLSDSSECQESIEVPDFDANDYQMFSAQEKDQITIMCIPFAMIKECK